jgi:hypothetical protein
MTRRALRSRPAIVTLAIAVIAGAVGYAGFHLAAGIRPTGLRYAVVTAFGVVQLAALGLSPAFIYYLARSRTTGRLAAIGLAVVVPLLWYAKEIVRMSEYLDGFMVVYGALHQLYLSLFAWIAAVIAGADLVLRVRMTKRLPVAPALTVVVALLGLALFVLVDGGAVFARWYMQLYGVFFL